MKWRLKESWQRCLNFVNFNVTFDPSKDTLWHLFYICRFIKVFCTVKLFLSVYILTGMPPNLASNLQAAWRKNSTILLLYPNDISKKLGNYPIKALSKGLYEGSIQSYLWAGIPTGALLSKIEERRGPRGIRCAQGRIKIMQMCYSQSKLLRNDNYLYKIVPCHN